MNYSGNWTSAHILVEFIIINDVIKLHGSNYLCRVIFQKLDKIDFEMCQIFCNGNSGHYLSYKIKMSRNSLGYNTIHAEKLAFSLLRILGLSRLFDYSYVTKILRKSG